MNRNSSGPQTLCPNSRMSAALIIHLILMHCCSFKFKGKSDSYRQDYQVRVRDLDKLRLGWYQINYLFRTAS
jgi:hypothetical protein